MPAKMRIFGITGGIGSGKSTVSGLLTEAGVPVVDADRLARLSVAPGGPGLSQVVREFGPSVLGTDGEMDRKRMGQMAFSSVEVRAKLNAILHPMITDLARAAFAKLESDGVELAAYDCPLLFESGLQARYRPTVVVFVSPEEQVRRVMARNGLSEADAVARVASQMPLSEKARMADFVVDNSGTREELASRVMDLMRSVHGFRDCV
jgi:dephospho-CoA kinase